MNYAATIYNLLSNATALPVAPMNMLQQQEPPFVVYNINNINPMGYKGKVEAVDLVSFSVVIYSQDLDQAQSIANTLRAALTCAPTLQNSWMDTNSTFSRK